MPHNALLHLLVATDEDEMDDHTLSEDHAGPNMMHWNAVKDQVESMLDPQAAVQQQDLHNALRAVPQPQRTLHSRIYVNKPIIAGDAGSRVIRVAEEQEDV